MYLCWYDDNPKHDVPRKVADACAAYQARYGVPASAVLVATADAVAVAGVQVEGVGWVRANYVYVRIGE